MPYYIGFTNLGDINNHLATYEGSLDQNSVPVLANSMLVLMVRGLFSRLQFPYAQFACTSLTGDQFFDLFWEAVCRLERCGFKVVACTCDGLSSNRRFMRVHYNASTDQAAKVLNPYSSNERYIYFLSDPPHLLKTTRNCWSSPKRCLDKLFKAVSSILHGYIIFIVV